MSDNKKMRPKNIDAKKLTDEEMESVNGGILIGAVFYVCDNPKCSMYLSKLQFNPPGGRCEECGQFLSMRH